MLDEAQEPELIRSVLVEALPEACRRVGRANLNDIVERRGQVRIVPMTGASRLDWTASLTLVVTSATLLGHCFVITRNILGPRNEGKPQALIHLVQKNDVGEVVQPGSEESPDGRIVLFNQIIVSLPPEILDRLEPGVVEKLVATFVSHLEISASEGGSR